MVCQLFSDNFEKFNMFVTGFYYVTLLGYIQAFLYYLSCFMDLLLLMKNNKTFVEHNHKILGSKFVKI